ncbi:hypothetical protein Pan258_56320 [Symmachiella dynata]|nr:hypothetical protein Pan258_56320 [Symmachiella dynata]
MEISSIEAGPNSGGSWSAIQFDCSKLIRPILKPRRGNYKQNRPIRYNPYIQPFLTFTKERSSEILQAQRAIDSARIP